MYPPSSNGYNRETEDTVYFYTTAFHPLENFSAHSVKLWGRIFPTAEHAFQWKKFESVRPDIAERILSATSPDAVKKISDPNKRNQRENWDEIRVSVMEEILKAKLAQHLDVQEVLKKTGKRAIVENSPYDSFWGIGSDGLGKNVVGTLWVKIRDSVSP